MLTLEMMQRRWPHANDHIPGLIEGIVASSDTVFKKYGLITDNNALSRRVVAHFMAQASEECGCGTEMVENLNFDMAGLLRVFANHFTRTLAFQCQHNQQAIGCIAYGGRMGNKTVPALDGYNYRGRGPSQVTGLDGYTKLRNFLKDHGLDIDILAQPELINDPKYTLECGVADWILCGCLPHAQADDILAETKALNGGTNGLAEREHQYALWKPELGV